MSKTPEGDVKKRVKALLDEYHCYHNWPVPAGYGTPMLDCVGCHRGQFFMVECKAPGEKPTPRQNLTIEQVEAAGGRVFVVGERKEYADPASDKDWWYSGIPELEAWLLELTH